MKKLLLSASFITIIVMGINFLFKIYLSYHIDKENLGMFYTFMDLISIGIMLFSGYKDSLIKAYDENGFKQVVYWYIVSFWLLFGVVLFIETFYYLYYFDNKIFSIYYLIVMLFSNALMIFLSYYNASWKIYKVMLFENMVMAISLVIFFSIFYNFVFHNIKALFFAFFFSYLARVIYLKTTSPIKFDYKKAPLNKVKLFLKNNLLSSLMYFFSGLFISSSSLVLLKLFNDTDFLSEYQVVIRSIFFSLVAIFVFPLNTFTFPQISKFISENNLSELQRVEKKLLYYLSVFLLILIFGEFLTPYIISFVFPKEYYNSYKMLNLLLPTLPFIAYTTFALNIIKGFNRFDLALYVRVFGSFLFFLSVYTLYSFGFDAKSIIYSLEISFLGMFGLSYFYKTRLLR